MICKIFIFNFHVCVYIIKERRGNYLMKNYLNFGGSYIGRLHEHILKILIIFYSYIDNYLYIYTYKT